MVSFTVFVPGKCLRLSPGRSTFLLMMCASGRGPATSPWTGGILAGPFPGPDPTLASIEDSFVVQLADLLACVFVKQIPQRAGLVKDSEILPLICCRNSVRAEEKST